MSRLYSLAAGSFGSLAAALAVVLALVVPEEAFGDSGSDCASLCAMQCALSPGDPNCLATCSGSKISAF